MRQLQSATDLSNGRDRDAPLPSFTDDGHSCAHCTNLQYFDRSADGYDRWMCNRYDAPTRDAVERHWAVRQIAPQEWDDVLFPRGHGPFIRRAHADAGFSKELVVGQWGLIPWFAKEPKLKYPTNNARSEELADKASYKHPWARGQRCIIPANTFDEPNWETGKNVWWRFRRSDGQPWGLAGLWNTWTDKSTGEVHESYTMILGAPTVTQ